MTALTRPAHAAVTLSRFGVAMPIVLTRACSYTTYAVKVFLANLVAQGPFIAGGTNTFPRFKVTPGIVVTFAQVVAIFPPPPFRTLLIAGCAYPAGRALAFAIHRITSRVIIAVAFQDTIGPKGP